MQIVDKSQRSIIFHYMYYTRIFIYHSHALSRRRQRRYQHITLYGHRRGLIRFVRMRLVSLFIVCMCKVFFLEDYYCFYRTQSHCTSTSRDRHSSRRLHLFRYLIYYYVYDYYIRYVYELGLRARYDCIRT